jgi:hypothetical protein
MDDLNPNSTPEAQGSATPETAPDLGATGTVQSSGEASGQGAPAEETFTKVDPRTLPPQLRSTYDNMLRDYKEKTTKLSETVKAESAKAAEAFRQKAEYYDQIAGQEEFVKRWNEYVQQTQGMTQAQADGNPELAAMKAQLQEVNQKIQLSEMTQVTEAFAEAVDEKGQKLHSDFDKLNELNLGRLVDGNEAEDFSLLRACIELSPGNTPQEKLANGYKSAKAVYSAIYEEGRKAGLGRVQQKQLNGSNPPTGSSGDALQITERKPKSAKEALEMAKRGMMVSRE